MSFSFLLNIRGHGDLCLVTMLQCLVTMNEALNGFLLSLQKLWLRRLCLVTMNEALKRLSPQFFFKCCGYGDLCQSDDFALTMNEAIKRFLSPSVLMQKSFWWVRYSVRGSSLPLER